MKTSLYHWSKHHSFHSESNHHDEPAQASEQCQRPVTKSKKRKAQQEDAKSKLLNEAVAILAKLDDELDAFFRGVQIAEDERSSAAQM
ncbi:hypothetical protein XENTR_v10016667 [Xenopus tropicalis]|nr:hypothetical protein XENTR_v10016667 [Xenopus tropicalis]